MTNSETIEKLNEALGQLIDAYKILKDKNEELENNIKDKDIIINDLENKLDDISGSTKVQSTKMDGMLNRIQTLLTTSKSENTQNTQNTEEEKNDIIEKELGLEVLGFIPYDEDVIKSEFLGKPADLNSKAVKEIKKVFNRILKLKSST